jgi:hypothetical protein
VKIYFLPGFRSPGQKKHCDWKPSIILWRDAKASTGINPGMKTKYSPQRRRGGEKKPIGRKRTQRSQKFTECEVALIDDGLEKMQRTIFAFLCVLLRLFPVPVFPSPRLHVLARHSLGDNWSAVN